MIKINKKLYKRLKSFSRDSLYDILTKSGIHFTESKKEDLTKEELLLVADEADMDILFKLLTDLDLKK